MKLSIIIPVRNEETSLKIIIPVLESIVNVPHETFIVYDEKDDTSIPAARRLKKKFPNLSLVHNKKGRGVANAIRSGIQKTRGEYILIYAADDVGPATSILPMLQMMEKGYDMVSGTRYAHGGRRIGGSLIGGILSRTANLFFYSFSPMRLTDATTGFKMFRRSALQALSFDARHVGWVVAFELSIKAQLAELRVGEVPIVAVDRLFGGKSSFNLQSWVIEYTRWLIWGILQLWKKELARKQ